MPWPWPSRWLRQAVGGLVCCWLLLAPPLQAEQDGFYVAPGLQWAEFHDEAVPPELSRLGSGAILEDDTWGSFALGYDLSRNFGLELRAFDLDPQVVVAGREETLDLDYASLDVFFGLGRLGPVQPFLAAGFGQIRFGDDGQDEDIWNLGLGLRFPLTRRLKLRTTLRAMHLPDRDAEDTEYDYGADLSLLFYLGGSRETSVSAAPKPQRKK